VAVVAKRLAGTAIDSDRRAGLVLQQRPVTGSSELNAERNSLP